MAINLQLHLFVKALFVITRKWENNSNTYQEINKVGITTQRNIFSQWK